ncbi:Tripartite-type tricarboxylate transporter, receptor component TctC [Roseomonas rosea]|uniref:Tripartite-type tricarboxylate transporter, receptor component TctC n=1 Tax=Muricoccus roseus TaxID=198092 RepID=A0A1M6D598_9PROT|nr:Bug family tripartite tricarboxylate transporter substrate binding protein [Roseomonas rosea]SHI68435.1 Tripartite-type tricarboxylate transporter, receptor component TctC [Roseomonas rosea]
MHRTPFARRALLGGAAALAAGLAARPGHAQLLNRPARILVGFPPGGSTDTVTRLYAERMRPGFAPQILVENRSGAGGRLAIETVKAATADGTTVLLTPSSMLTIYPHIYTRTLRYDALTELTPVSPVCTFPFGFAVSAAHPAKDLAGFVAWAKTQGAAVPFASPAAGSLPHFLGMQLGKAIGVEMSHVPYRGAAPALQDLLAGSIPAVMVVLGEATEMHHAGQLRILAHTAPMRLPRLPALPNFAELGFPALTAEEWFGMLLPAGAPAEVVEGLQRSIAAAAARPDMVEALQKLEYRALTSSPAEFAARIRADRERMGPIVRESGFKAEE